MRRFSKIVSTTTVIAAAIGSFCLTPVTATAESSSMTMVEQGKEIAFNRKKGNCLACHAVRGGDLPGNIAPPLVAMKQRFPEKAVLRAQIWDPTDKNPNTIMPPFGRHQILSEGEIDKLVEFVYQL